MKIFAAPLQGVTDCVWRHFHAKHYPESIDEYTATFVRVEKGEPRKRDIRDVCSDLNVGVATSAQIIFSGIVEFILLTEALLGEGWRRIDLNMGCPFPLQVNHGRGAGILVRPNMMAEVAREMESWAGEVSFSVKMRTGVRDSAGWERLMDIVNRMPVESVTIHPRTAAQQYGGEPDRELFGQMAAMSVHRVVYNGDVRTPEEFRLIAERFPEIEGVMIGRGLCGRPSLAAEIREGREWPSGERLERLLGMHDEMREYYERVLCGVSQIVGKLKEIWEYSEDEIGRKAWKAIRKSTGLKGYDRAISMIGRE